MTTSVRDTDRGASRIEAMLAGLAASPQRVSVGVHAAEGDAPHAGSGGTVGAVAAVLEFGDADTSPRPWLRPAVDGQEATIGRDLVGAYERALLGADAAGELLSVGESLAANMRAGIATATGQTRDAITARPSSGASRG